MIKIATYNINSVRLRIDRAIDLLTRHQCDILCLQETKVENHLFPRNAFEEAGWQHIYFEGEKSYNGVAIISRIPLTNVQAQKITNNDTRHISATLPSGATLHNFYIPAGGDEPDIKINPKFKHKLDFIDYTTTMLRESNPKDGAIILGDFNIAPYEHDVWSHKQLLKVVSHTPIEVEKLSHMKQSLDFIDVAREFIPEEEKCYSWWSYRNRDWRKSNRGRRLDHIWITPNLKNHLNTFDILSDLRDGEKPSDHVPVIIELDI